MGIALITASGPHLRWGLHVLCEQRPVRSKTPFRRVLLPVSALGASQNMRGLPPRWSRQEQNPQRRGRRHLPHKHRWRLAGEGGRPGCGAHREGFRDRKMTSEPLGWPPEPLGSPHRAPQRPPAAGHAAGRRRSAPTPAPPQRLRGGRLEGGGGAEGGVTSPGGWGRGRHCGDGKFSAPPPAGRALWNVPRR